MRCNLLFASLLLVSASGDISTNQTSSALSDAPKEYTDQAVLRCSTESVGRFKPDIQFDWYKNGTHILQAPELFGRIKMTQNGALVMNRVNNFMHGEYICNINASNHTIGITTIIFETLQHVPVGRRCNEEKCMPIEDCYAPAPDDEMGLCSTINDVCCDLEHTAPIGILAKGKTALLPCPNNTAPDMQYEWMKNSIRLSDHPTLKDKFSIAKSGHLLINSVADNDYGGYTCVVNGSVAGEELLDETKILDPKMVNPKKCVQAKDCKEPVQRGACPEEGEIECSDLTDILLTHCTHFDGKCRKSCDSAYSRNALDCPRGFTCCTNSTLLEPLMYISTAAPETLDEIVMIGKPTTEKTKLPSSSKLTPSSSGKLTSQSSSKLTSSNSTKSTS